MIDSGFSASFCVALAWKAARSCWSGLEELVLVEPVEPVELVELVLVLESVLELEESAWCPW